MRRPTTFLLCCTPLARAVLLGAMLVGTTVLLGCGAVHRKATFSSTGAADPAADNKIRDDFKTARATPLPAEAQAVTVLIDTVPEGVSLEGGVLGVEEGYEHVILGKFALTGDAGIFPAYKTSWRKPYCYPQSVLVVGTLFLWALVPTFYPCFTTENVSKAEMVDALKLLAYEAGGNMVIATYVTHDQDRAAQAVGFVLQADARVLGGLGVSGKDDEAADEEEPADATEGAEGEDDEAPKD
jgi:hypothetical protein